MKILVGYKRVVDFNVRAYAAYSGVSLKGTVSP